MKDPQPSWVEILLPRLSQWKSTAQGKTTYPGGGGAAPGWARLLPGPSPARPAIRQGAGVWGSGYCPRLPRPLPGAWLGSHLDSMTLGGACRPGPATGGLADPLSIPRPHSGLSGHCQGKPQLLLAPTHRGSSSKAQAGQDLQAWPGVRSHQVQGPPCMHVEAQSLLHPGGPFGGLQAGHGPTRLTPLPS